MEGCGALFEHPISQMMIDDGHYDDDGHIGIDEDDDLADTLAPSLVLVLVLLVPFVVVAVWW